MAGAPRVGERSIAPPVVRVASVFKSRGGVWDTGAGVAGYCTYGAGVGVSFVFNF